MSHFSYVILCAGRIVAIFGLSVTILGANSKVVHAATVDGPPVVWDLTYLGVKRGATIGLFEFSDAISEATGGNFKVNIHLGAGLAPPKEAIDGIKIGAFQAAGIVEGWHPGKVPTLGILGLPFLPLGDSFDIQSRVAFAYYDHPEVLKDGLRWNTRFVMPLLVPGYEITGRGNPPAAIADLKGRRIHAPGGFGAALKKVGVIPTSIPEYYGALERGLLDGVVINHPANIGFKLYEVSTWYSTNLRLGILPVVVGVSQTAIDALPPQYKKLVNEAARKSVAAHALAYEAEMKKAIDIFNQKDLKPVSFTAADRDAFIEIAARPVWDEWIGDMEKNGQPGRMLLDFVLSEAKKAAM